MLVICNGMMRSGSTLQYNIAAALLERNCGVNRMGFLGEKDDPDVREKLRQTARKDEWAIVKTHEFIAVPENDAHHIMVLFTFRDIRDIAASIRKKWNYTFEQIIEILDSMIELEEKTRRWPNSLIQKYETMYSNLESSVAEIAKKFSIEIEPEICAALAEEFSVARVSQRLEASSFSLIPSIFRRFLKKTSFDELMLLHEKHISTSQGRPGAWGDVMSSEEIEVLSTRYADWLSGHGYLVP